MDECSEEIEELTIVPASGGVFDVEVDGDVVFAKKEAGRFPADGEIVGLLP